MQKSIKIGCEKERRCPSAAAAAAAGCMDGWMDGWMSVHPKVGVCFGRPSKGTPPRRHRRFVVVEARGLRRMRHCCWWAVAIAETEVNVRAKCVVVF